MTVKAKILAALKVVVAAKGEADSLPHHLLQGEPANTTSSLTTLWSRDE